MTHIEKHGTELAARYPADVLRFALVEALRRRAMAIEHEAARKQMVRRLITLGELLSSIERGFEEEG